MKRRTIVAGLALVSVASPAMATDPRLARDVLRGVNAFRAGAGRAPLRLDPRLSRAATLHSLDMLRTNRLSHTGSDGSDAGLRLTRAGFAWSTCRENIGAGYQDTRQALHGWIDSPAHRDNLLARTVTAAGIGFAGGPGVLPGNVPRLFWTLVLAAPR